MPAVQSPFSPQPPERNPLRLIENEKNDVLSNIEDLKQNLHTLECRLKSVQRRLNSLSDCQLVVDVNPYSKKGIFNAQPSSSDQQKTGAQPITDPRLSQDFIIDESSPPSTESSEANTSQLHSNSTFKSFASEQVNLLVSRTNSMRENLSLKQQEYFSKAKVSLSHIKTHIDSSKKSIQNAFDQLQKSQLPLNLQGKYTHFLTLLKKLAPDYSKFEYNCSRKDCIPDYAQESDWIIPVHKKVFYITRFLLHHAVHLTGALLLETIKPTAKAIATQCLRAKSPLKHLGISAAQGFQKLYEAHKNITLNKDSGKKEIIKKILISSLYYACKAPIALGICGYVLAKLIVKKVIKSVRPHRRNYYTSSYSRNTRNDRFNNPYGMGECGVSSGRSNSARYHDESRSAYGNWK